MSKFSITEDIAPVFRKDLEFFRAETMKALLRMLGTAEPEVGVNSFVETARHAHTLKGLASMVGAAGLSLWGQDLERLWEIAPTFLHSAREKAAQIARFILEEGDGPWGIMNELTLSGDLDGAQTIYASLRRKLDESWSTYLAEPVSNHSVNEGTQAIAHGVTPFEVVAPLLKRREAPAPIGIPSSPGENSRDVHSKGSIADVLSIRKVSPTGDGANLPQPEVPRLRRKSGAPVVPASPQRQPEMKETDGATTSTLPPPEPYEDLREVLREEVAIYLGALGPLIEKMSLEPQKVVNWEEARRLFHTIKGAAATVGIESVAALAKSAETRCVEASENRESRDWAALQFCQLQANEIARALGLAFEIELGPEAIGETGEQSKPELEEQPDAEMMGFFAAEAVDNADSIEKALLLWERGIDSSAQAAAIQRAFHTIKGAANSLGLRRLGSSVHLVEELLEHMAASGQEAGEKHFSFLLQASDQIRDYTRALSNKAASQWEHDWAPMVGSFEREISAPASSSVPRSDQPVPTAATEESEQVLNVETPRLNRLMSLVGEMVTDRSRLRRSLEQIAAFQVQLRERNHSLSSTVANFQQEFEFNLLRDRAESTLRHGSAGGDGGSGEFSELEFDRYDQFSVLSRSLVEMAHDMEQVLSEMQACVENSVVENAQFTQTSKLLQGEITGLSLVPISALYPRLNRAFRDAVQSVGKRADLVFEGAAVQVDKAVTDKIYAPLLHLVRNSVAHGIETPERRSALGKTPRGQVRMQTVQAANQFIIHLSDDGSGLDLVAIRERAIQRGIWSAETGLPSITEALGLIFQPGFSTAAAVTSVAGRGVGLDVVRQEIENLNGSIDYTAVEGEGAHWTIRLPLSISISEATVAEAGGCQFAFPLNFVESGVILSGTTTRGAKQEELYQHGSELLPVLRLHELLRLPGDCSTSTRGVVVSAGGRRAVVFVERVLARQEIVVKELDTFLRTHPLLTGGTVDSEGRVIPVLNIPALLAYNESASSHSQNTRHAEMRALRQDESALKVLIVDDSLSVRKMQTRMLKALGCDVTAAHDGLDALDRLRAERYDLIFTDLEMPRVNGYELIVEIRANFHWASIPTVVISSRGSDKYVNKAMALGASTFLSKPFTEEQLEAVLSHYAGWDPKSRRRIPALSAA